MKVIQLIEQRDLMSRSAESSVGTNIYKNDERLHISNVTTLTNNTKKYPIR